MALCAEKGNEMSDLNKFEVVGTVSDVTRKSVGQKNTLLVELSLDQRWENWQGGEDVNPLVLKVLGKKADKMFNPGPDIGDKVNIQGFIEGRVWKDRVYLDLQIDTITVLEQAVSDGDNQDEGDGPDWDQFVEDAQSKPLLDTPSEDEVPF
jgi:hypothetical protein